jgi:hypothetical protein
VTRPRRRGGRRRASPGHLPLPAGADATPPAGHRQTDVADRYFTRVDVTEEFPFLVSKMAPYYDH